MMRDTGLLEACADGLPVLLPIKHPLTSAVRKDVLTYSLCSLLIDIAAKQAADAE